MRQQRFHLAAEVLIPGAGFLEHRGPAALLGVQSLVEDALDFSPAFRFHLPGHSFRAGAMPSRVSSRASPFPAKPSAPPRGFLHAQAAKKRISTTWHSRSVTGSEVLQHPKVGVLRPA